MIEPSLNSLGFEERLLNQGVRYQIHLGFDSPDVSMQQDAIYTAKRGYT